MIANYYNSEIPQEYNGNYCNSEIPQEYNGNYCNSEIPQEYNGNYCNSEIPQEYNGNYCNSEIPQEYNGNYCNSEILYWVQSLRILILSNITVILYTTDCSIREYQFIDFICLSQKGQCITWIILLGLLK